MAYAKMCDCLQKHITFERQEEQQCSITVVIDSDAPTQVHFRT